jgi:uncharacterized protein YcnI
MQMKRVLGRIAAAVAMGMMGSAIAQAHITIAPNQSMAGATEKYVLRVPTEGKVATVAAELDIPEGVVVEVVGMPGVKYEAKRNAENRITNLVWTMNVRRASSSR